jgi:hypothetical protein
MFKSLETRNVVRYRPSLSPSTPLRKFSVYRTTLIDSEFQEHFYANENMFSLAVVIRMYEDRQMNVGANLALLGKWYMSNWFGAGKMSMSDALADPSASPKIIQYRNAIEKYMLLV